MRIQRDMKKQREEEMMKNRKYELDIDDSKHEDPRSKEEKRLRDIEYQRKLEESRKQKQDYQEQ